MTYTEFVFNFSVNTEERVHVNATSPAGLEVEFDISLHQVPCAILSIDANDPTGQRQSLHLDKKHHVWKHRLSKRGAFIGSRSQLELGSTLLEEGHLFEVVKNLTGDNATAQPNKDDFAVDPDYCGSCFGAGEEDECCNSCDDVKRAYARRGWVLHDLEAIEQCKGQITAKDESGEGCNVHGKVALSTGGGNLHLAPNRGLETFGSSEGVSIIDVFLRTFEQFNVSHTINKIRFGETYPGKINQLDGEERFIEDAYGMYQYYIQVRGPRVCVCKRGKAKESFPLFVGGSDALQVPEWHNHSNQPVFGNGAHASCQSWFRTWFAGGFLLLRGVGLARGD